VWRLDILRSGWGQRLRPNIDPRSAAEQASPVSGISRNVYILSIVSLFTDISSEMLYPLIPIFVTSILGAPVAIVGMMEGAAEMTASLLKGVSGWLSDRTGVRRPFVIAGYSVSALAKPMLALAGAWPIVLAARVLDRFGKGVRGSARDAILAESSLPEVRGRAFGFHRSADQIGAVAGPLLAVPLLALFANNFRALFIAAFIPAAAGAVLLFKVKETGRSAGGAKGAVAPRSLRWRDTSPAFRRFLLITLVFALGNSSDVFLILRAKQIGIGTNHILVLFALYNLMTVISAFPAGRLSDSIGRKRLLTGGLFLFALIYTGFAFATTAAEVWLLFAAYGVHVGINDGLSRAFAVDLASPGHRATALGLHATATGITTFAASAIAGALWTWSGPAPVFLYGAVMAIIAGIGLIFIVRPGSSVWMR
jgi:MFS family permease